MYTFLIPPMVYKIKTNEGEVKSEFIYFSIFPYNFRHCAHPRRESGMTEPHGMGLPGRAWEPGV